MAGDIIVRLIGDVRDLDNKFASIGSKLDKLAGKFSSAGKKLTSHLTLPLVGLGLVAFESASKLEQSMESVSRIFGSSSGAVEAFASTSETSLGMTKQATLDAVAQFGNMFEAMGIGTQKAASMSESIVQLAADMSAFKGGSVEDALQALQSGMAGNLRGLRQYGVVLTQAQIQQEAYKLGLVSSTTATKAAGAADHSLEDARRRLSDATQSAAEANALAARAVSDAEANAADAAKSAARGVTDADASVKTAEESLASAQRDAKNAQMALTDAREAAKRSLEDLSLKVKENAVAEKDAVFRVQDAQKALNEAYASGDPDKIARAQTDLQDAQLGLAEAQKSSARDQEELTKKQKAGIAGSDEMKAAQDKLTQAHKSVSDAQKGVTDAEQHSADARAAQAKTAKDNARSISDAQAAQAKTIRDGARSISDAQRSITRAMESAASAAEAATGGLTPAAKAQAVYALVLQQTGKIHGEFARRSKSAEEQQKILKAHFIDTAAAIGNKLMPAGLKILEWAGHLLDKFSHLSPKTQELILKFALAAAALGPILRIVGGVIRVFSGLISVFRYVGLAVQFLMANPIILAVAAIAVAVYLIYKHWAGISKWFKEVWANVKHWFDDAWQFVKNLFLNFTPEGLIIKHWRGIAGFFSGVWRDVKHWFSDAWEFAKNLFLNFTPEGLIFKHWRGIAGFFRGIWKDVKAGFQTAWHAIAGIVKTEINLVITAINAIISGINTLLNVHVKIPSWVPLVGGKTLGWDFSIPKIPTLDQGAIVTGPTLALLSKNSKPEAVVPLGKAGAFGTTVVNNYFTVNVPPTVNKAEVGRAVVDAVKAYEKANGKSWRAA